MIKVNQKQLKRIMDLSAIAGRLDELNRFEGYVPSAAISRRKSILKRQLNDMLKKEKAEEEQTVHISIELPETRTSEKKEKSFVTNLKNLITGNLKEEEDDDDIFVIVNDILPKEDREVLGRVVKEL